MATTGPLTTRVPIRPLAVAAVLMMVGLAGCGDPVEEGTEGTTGSQPAFILCDGPAGSWTDLTDEPAGQRAELPIVDWTDEAGCAIRLDTIFHTFGDGHCDWEDVEYISLGIPIGEPFSGPDATPPEQDWEPLFLFNSDGAVANLPAGERLDVEDVPADAVDTGLTTATGRRLRLSADELTLYEIQGSSVRAFVATDDDDVSCA